MEITLEKIELVKDRTGVTYKEAKEALEAAEGNVVDAIIAIEETVDGLGTTKAGAKKDAFVTKMKEIAKKGNVSKIVVSRDGETIINIPLTVGILGTVVAPWGMIAGTVAAFGFKCKVEFVKDDGSVIDISEKAEDIYEDAVEKGSDIYADIKEKAPGVYDDLKEKSSDMFAKAKEKAQAAKGKFAKNGVDFEVDICDGDCENCDEPCEDPFEEYAEDKTAAEKVEDALDACEDKVEDVLDAIEDRAEDVLETAADAVEEALKSAVSTEEKDN